MEVGQQISEPYFSWVRDRKIALYHDRKCKSCGQIWVTASVPLFKNWSGTLGDCCPEHMMRGRVVVSYTPTSAITHGGETFGLLRTLTYGGVYRRWGCPACTTCGHKATLHVTEQELAKKAARRTQHYLKNNKDKEHLARWLNAIHPGCLRIEPYKGMCDCQEYLPCSARWTTMELHPQGLIVKDISLCPFCDSPSQVKPLSIREMGKRSAMAKTFARQIGKPYLKPTSFTPLPALSSQQPLPGHECDDSPPPHEQDS